MNLNELNQFLKEITDYYIKVENNGIPLPVDEIVFVHDMLSEILKREPYLSSQPSFDKSKYESCGGYTVLLPNNAATILIKKEGSMNNFYWMATLVHELTHVKDYLDYLSILNMKTLVEMKNHLPFWLWTEFHAKYKGYMFLLMMIKKCPEQMQQYIQDTLERVYSFEKTLDMQTDFAQKGYYTMHLIGELLAYEHSSIKLDDNLYKNLTEKFNWFEEMKNFLNNHIEKITITETLTISMNIRRIFTLQ